MTEEDGRALISAWTESGLGPSAFCRSRGIGLHRLWYWRRRLEQSSFVEVLVEPAPEEGAVQPLVGGDGIEVLVGETWVRFPDRPGMAKEILDSLMGGRPQ